MVKSFSLLILFILVLNCIAQDSINYPLLQRNIWKLNYITINNIKMISYPFSLTSKTNVLKLVFRNTTCFDECKKSIQNDFKNDKGFIDSEGTAKIEELCNSECDVQTRDVGITNAGSMFSYTYSDYCNGSNCLYKTLQNRLLLINCGFSATNCIPKGINIKDLDSICNISYEIAFHNNYFNVSKDSLILCDSLGRCLVFKPLK